MTLKVFEGFVGVGSQHMALRDLGIEHAVVATSDWDYPATLAYHAMHTKFPIDWACDTELDDIVKYLFKIKISSNGKDPMTLEQIKRLPKKKKRDIYNAFLNANNLGSITEIDPKDIPDHDMFTYSFPCQDISVVGQQKGLDEGSGTRSGLLWECKKVIEAKNQKYLLMENVKNLVGKKHKINFNKWCKWLESQGYTNYWQVLNAKDYEVPQNRERVFMVSVLGEHEPFEFPKPVELTVRLKDVLEEKVDEKYYLSGEKANQLLSTIKSKNDISSRVCVDGSINDPKIKEVSNCIISRYDAGVSNQKSTGLMVVEPACTNKKDDQKIIQKARGFNKGGEHKLSPTITASSWQENNLLLEGIDVHPFSKRLEFGGYRQSEISPCLLATDYKAPKTIMLKESVELPVIAASRGRNPGNPSDRTVQKDNYVVEESGLYTGDSPEFHRGPLEGLSRTIKASSHDAGVTDGYLIRKLTPLECWRLMDFTDEDFYKAQAVCSNSQLYKQAGNSIVKRVLMAIFAQLFR